MSRKPKTMRILLWIGMLLFLLWFLASAIAPDRMLSAAGLAEHPEFILRLYGIFQLSWAILFFFALKDIEKNLAIINGAIITGAVVVIFFVIYQVASVKSGWYLLLCAALLLVYTLLLFLCKPKSARP